MQRILAFICITTVQFADFNIIGAEKKVLLVVQYLFFRSPDISDGAAAAFPEGGAPVHPGRPLDSTLPVESGGIKILKSTFEIDAITEKGFQLLFPTVARAIVCWSSGGSGMGNSNKCLV